jgi:acetylornithine deacetylase/succinyl-diaminopimelate desuccinylase-like protein
MILIRTIVLTLLLCLLCGAAEPDWPRVEEQAIALLQKYVRIASVNPPGDTRETARFLESELASIGLKSELFESNTGGKTNLLARLPGKDQSKRPLLLLNHMDVVPVDASRWKMNPFGAQVENNMFYGRGSLDMKSTGIMQLMAIVLLKQLGIVPSRDILFLSDCDEETGGTDGVTWMINHQWDKLNPEYVLDEGGAGSRDLYAPGKLVFGVSIADKQVLWLKLHAEGTAGHGSQPIPNNANDILMRAIEKARDLPPPKNPNQLVSNLRKDLGEVSANKFMNALQGNTISLTSLRSGVGDPPKANVIPSIAEATIDCRLLPGQNAEEFISEIKARINDPRVKVERISPKPDDPQPSSTATPLYEAIRTAIRKTNPSADVLPIVVPYGTDGQKFRVRGITAYGLIPMVLEAATVATMHSDSEHIPLDEFRKALHIYFDIVRADF